MRCRIGITIELLYIVIQRPTLYKQFLAAAAAARASARRTVRQATGREDVATAHGAATHQAEANKRAAVAYWHGVRAAAACASASKAGASTVVRLSDSVCASVSLSICLSVRVGRVSFRPDRTGVARMAREVRGPPATTTAPGLVGTGKKRRACGLQ